MQVRMKSSYAYEIPGRPGVRRTLPIGWTGELPEEIARAAEAAGTAVIADAPVEPGAGRKVRRTGRGRAAAAPKASGAAAGGEPGTGGGEAGAGNAAAGGEGAGGAEA